MSEQKCSFCGRKNSFLHAITSVIETATICHECLDSGKKMLDQLEANKHIRDHIAKLESELAEARKPRRVVINAEFESDDRYPDGTPIRTCDYDCILDDIRAANCIPVDREWNEIK
jgi:hypothetical protein